MSTLPLVTHAVADENLAEVGVSAGRGLADVALQEWRLQSPLKWNHGALHSSPAFERFQRCAMKRKRLRQLEMIQTPKLFTLQQKMKMNQPCAAQLSSQL
ncbi:unnamed protein product [Pleuronectes platessa]|uniref:Uncharacterized protein n=1 Tax=Pleuronectes platessa TaxID=8262 RepID=A0A9N7UMU1_PLEPL|nr:unnamed protein product [Pleuronectes platessa]